MSHVRKVYILGRKPTHSKEVNDLIKAFDLGIEGTYVNYAGEATLELESWPLSEEQKNGQLPALKEALEMQGWLDVEIFDIGFFEKEK